MQKAKQLAEVFLLAISGFLIFLLIFQHRVELPTWLKVGGRMHPMFLHFPIVLVFVALLSWWIFPDNKFPGWSRSLLLIAALAATITALMGLLLSLEETREGGAFVWHKWTGIGVALLSAAIYWFSPVISTASGKIAGVFTCVVLIIAGHYGAVLTHGKNYLSAPMAIASKVPVSKAIIFDDVIKPVFEKCTGCHNADNKKGGLDLESPEGIAAGGKTGALYKTGDPSMSLIMHRIFLPPGEKKHMPPASKPQLNEEEIQLVYTWIRSGCLTKEKLTQLPVQDSFRILASRYLQNGEVDFNQPVYTFSAADPETIKKLNSNSRVVEQLGTGSPALSVQFYGKEYYSSAALKELSSVREQITELNLAKLPVTDDDLSTVASFSHLNKLNLNYTAVTDKGLEKLLELKSLQSVSLSGTAAGKELITRLAALPQMHSIFIWNTKIDSTGVAALQKKFAKLQIESGFVDNNSTEMPLPPPRFETSPGIVSLPVKIGFNHPVKGTVIRYTLDGSHPDSVTGTIYTSPLKLDSNVTVIAKAFKDGWYSSGEVQGQFIAKGKRPDSIIGITQPDYRYNNGTDILMDGDLGEIRYQNGAWLAYQKLNAEYELVYNRPVSVNTISVNMLENTGAQIFPAVSIEVWDVSKSDQPKLLGKIKPELPIFNRPTKFNLEKIKFAEANVQRLRVKVQHLNHLPGWHGAKGNPGWVLISEILVN